MDESLEDLLDDKFGVLSLNVSQSPLALGNWVDLLNYLLEKAHPLNKRINPQLLELIRHTYGSLFTYFPLLENYSVDCALLEYKLGNVKEMHAVFTAALQRHNNSSLLLWLEYLKLCNEVVTNHKQLFRKYELAESHVGLHFYSGEFWELYLEQIKLRCTGHRRYLAVLRKVLEVPAYSYSKFFALWLHAIDEIKDVKQLTLMAPELEIHRKIKVRVRGRERKGPQLQEGKKALRKFTKELYMVTQHRVLEIYNLFEINIKTHFYCSAETLIEKSEITAWSRYLDFSVENGVDELTHLNFQRALLPLAHYEMIWLKFAAWLIENSQDYLTSKNVLSLGLQLSHKKAKILEKLCGLLIKLGKQEELVLLFQQTQAAFDDKIEETDDFELFMDYFQFTLFVEKWGHREAEGVAMNILRKRLSYGGNKKGQEELLHLVCQMYARFSREVLEEQIFRLIIDEDWSYYLDSAKFWYEYCNRVWTDQETSYLENRRYIVQKILPLVSKRSANAKQSVISFCETYMPEDVDVCYDTLGGDLPAQLISR
ncbi:LAME_0D08416g1_1 [Lachancea meyersii CBS 8951]|uniref:LAME_0D08416g1_1 n=1 Tax=Lachancea meyersii CBS 8951 TaxID=1266667 RepID=A0A1G4JAG0_9SACH|nr:LAME_0D08416g1_1 [Lachancea meyersii CBS 8951]